jgi:fructose-1,6-bisphosphatase I
MERSVVTLNRFILEEERRFPDATGAFSNMIQDLTLAAKLINRAVNQAGLVDVLGETGRENVHGERVKKLDEYAHEVIVAAMDHGGHLCVMASEEAEEIIPIPERFPVGDYVLLFDPLDGSSNIEANISIGTIFSVHRRISDIHASRNGTLEDCLQPGFQQVAAGYFLYGSSTILVYTTGRGVHGFTLDPSIGEFLLSHPDITFPDPGQKVYAINEGYFGRWSEAQRSLVRRLRGDAGGDGGDGFKLRYVGSLVADFHRTLLYGGLFMYPADNQHPSGKLRLLYEAGPLAFVCEQAGGRATNGDTRILQVQPEGLHQRTPLFIGTAEYVEMAGEHLAREAAAGG